MRITLRPFPDIKHSLRVNRNQAHQFFREVRKWFGKVNQTIFKLRDSKHSSDILLEKSGVIKKGIASVGMHLKFLEKQGFKDNQVEKDFKNIERRLEELLEQIRS